MACGWPNSRRSPIPSLVPATVAAAVGLELGGGELSARQRGAGARGAAPVGGAGHVRACDRRCGGDGRGCAAGRIGGFVSSLPAASRSGRRGSNSTRCRRLPSRPRTREDLLDYGAVRLFVERARAVEPDLALNGHQATTIAAICRRLDGIPLAIEMAAARLAALGVEELAGRLDERFHLLTEGRRTALPRHRTLAGDARLELRAAGGARAGASPPPGGVRRRIQPEGGQRGRGERRESGRRKSSTAFPAWSRSRSLWRRSVRPFRATACWTQPAPMRSRSSPKAANANGSRAAMPNITWISSSGPKPSWRRAPRPNGWATTGGRSTTCARRSTGPFHPAAIRKSAWR